MGATFWTGVALVAGGDPAPVDQCVVTAFGHGDAFVAQYDRRGFDSKVVFGVASDGQGHVTFLE